MSGSARDNEQNIKETESIPCEYPNPTSRNLIPANQQNGRECCHQNVTPTRWRSEGTKQFAAPTQHQKVDPNASGQVQRDQRSLDLVRIRGLPAQRVGPFA